MMTFGKPFLVVVTPGSGRCIIVGRRDLKHFPATNPIIPIKPNPKNGLVPSAPPVHVVGPVKGLLTRACGTRWN